MEYPLTADEAVKIPLTPKYVAADLADTIPYSVKVYLGSENTEPIESFEYRAVSYTHLDVYKRQSLGSS